MNNRSLLIAGIILIIALAPSVDDLVQAHQQGAPHQSFLWCWVALAAVVGLVYGEELLVSHAA